MKGLAKWFLLPAVLTAGMSLVWAGRAEAAKRRVHVRSPGYHASYVYRHRYPPYYRAPAYYWAPPPVRVRVYRPVPAVVYPEYRYVPAPVVAPWPVPYYRVW